MLKKSVFLGFGLALAACGGPEGAAPDTVEKRLESTLPGLIDSTFGSMDFLETSEGWNGLLASLDTFDQVTAGLPFGAEEQPLEPVPAAGEDGEASPPSGAEITEMLVTEIFNDSNYEGNGNYAIPGPLLCPDIEIYDEGTGDFTTEVDQECLDTVAAVEPRIHVETGGDGLDFTLLIGPNKAAPLTFELRSDSLALAADLAEAKEAAEHIGSVTGEGIELPDTMAGVLAASLTLHGPQDVAIALAIREELQIAGAFPDVGQLDFSSAIADPLVELRFNGIAETFRAVFDLNRTQLSMPWASVDAESNATGTFALDLQGISATLELDEQSAALPYALLISDIGLGDGQTTVKLDEFTLFALDLNADAGRHFDLLVSPGASGELPTLRFDPGFDLEMQWDLGVLAQAGDEVPSYLIDETYNIEVESGMQPVEGITEGGLKAVDGVIRVGSSAGGSIEVLAGQCLVASELESGEHEILGYLAAGACPQ